MNGENMLILMTVVISMFTAVFGLYFSSFERRRSSRQEELLREQIMELRVMYKDLEYRTLDTLNDKKRMEEISNDFYSNNIVSGTTRVENQLADDNKLDSLVKQQQQLMELLLNEKYVNENNEKYVNEPIDNKTYSYLEKIRYAQSVSADIAHSLKTPISGLKCAVDNLEEKLDENYREEFGDIYHMIELLEESIESYSDIGNYSADEDLEEGNYEGVLKNRLSLLALCCDKKINLKCNLDKELKLSKSQFKLLQIPIICIVENAFDMVEDNGIVEVDIRKTNNQIRIQISNDGPPIHTAIEDIFEDGYSTRESTGRGLYLAKEIIEKRLKGKLSAYNRADKGVTFLILLEEI